jgi:hypothetical protein
MPSTSRTTSPGQSVLGLHVSLSEVEPTVWRRLLVPGTVRLARLHDILQVAMGWEDSHLHCFRIGDRCYGQQFDDYPPDELDEKDATVLQAVRDHDRFVYEYDYGDGWEHEVIVESMSTTPRGLKFGVCLDGANACPPEDCGGPFGYTSMLAALADPGHEEHQDFVNWVGGPFDPASFDLAAVNVDLQHIR